MFHSHLKQNKAHTEILSPHTLFPPHALFYPSWNKVRNAGIILDLISSLYLHIQFMIKPYASAKCVSLPTLSSFPLQTFLFKSLSFIQTIEASPLVFLVWILGPLQSILHTTPKDYLFIKANLYDARPWLRPSRNYLCTEDEIHSLTLVYKSLHGLVRIHFSASSPSTSPFLITLQSYSLLRDARAPGAFSVNNNTP